MIDELTREKYNYLDKNEIESISNLLPTEEIVRKIVDFYAIFSDETRVKIITALAINEMCVTDLSTLFECNQSTISHQLKILRSCGLVDFRRKGKMIFYFLTNVFVDDVMSIGIENIKRNKEKY